MQPTKRSYMTGMLSAMFALAMGQSYREYDGDRTPGAFGSRRKTVSRKRKISNVLRGYYARYSHALSEVKSAGTPTSRKRARKAIAASVKRLNQGLTQRAQQLADYRNSNGMHCVFAHRVHIGYGRAARRAARNE